MKPYRIHRHELGKFLMLWGGPPSKLCPQFDFDSKSADVDSRYHCNQIYKPKSKIIKIDQSLANNYLKSGRAESKS